MLGFAEPRDGGSRPYGARNCAPPSSGQPVGCVLLVVLPRPPSASTPAESTVAGRAGESALPRCRSATDDVAGRSKGSKASGLKLFAAASCHPMAGGCTRQGGRVQQSYYTSTRRYRTIRALVPNQYPWLPRLDTWAKGLTDQADPQAVQKQAARQQCAYTNAAEQRSVGNDAITARTCCLGGAADILRIARSRTSASDGE